MDVEPILLEVFLRFWKRGDFLLDKNLWLATITLPEVTQLDRLVEVFESQLEGEVK